MRWAVGSGAVVLAFLVGSDEARAQITCGTYGAEDRPSDSESCPGGGGGGCSHVNLNARLVDCSGTATGGSCRWISEVTPTGGCTTCTPRSNLCSVRICAPSSCNGGSYLEVCDGFDNDGGGLVDEGCPGGAQPENLFARVSHLHAATGAFTPDSRQDVYYAGSTVPMNFSRVYTSLDYWPHEAGSRLAAGWFHTYDERLLDAATLGAPTGGSSTTIIHRRGAQGRRFTCSGNTCTTNDGTLDVLTWDPTNQFWRITGSEGLKTDFFGTGASWKKGALWRRQGTRGQGWTVTWYDSGALTGHIEKVTDEWGRILYFKWQPAATNGGPARLVELRDSSSSGTLLASFGYNPYHRLTTATSAAGAETYGYWTDGGGRSTRLLTTITIDSQAAVTVTYDAQAGEGWVGRVATIQEAGAYLRLRYRGATRNACATPSESTMIVDRSTAPVGQSSCTDDASGDTWCAGQAGIPAVCDGGLCRAIACQRYGDLVNGAGEDRVTAITGNCPCAGVSTVSWTSGGSEAPRRIAWQLTRDSNRTTFHYDTRGRLDAMCENDGDTSVTTTSSSCPSSGVWNRFEYTHSAFPTFITKQHARSRLDAASTTTATLTYDASHPELTQLQVVGLSRDAATDANQTETQTSTFSYDTSGRLSQETMPAGETTSYTYHTTTGPERGLLKTVERWLSGGSVRLITSYASYTVLGRPQSITAPSTAVTSYTYDYGGMRLLTRTIAGQVTTFTYQTSGRLNEVIEPSGRRTKYTYDAYGRVEKVDVRDAAASLAADRTEYVYDSAGRTIEVKRRRLDGSGNPLSVEWQLTATYQEHGYTKTQTHGPRSAISMQLDPNNMGRVTGITREDGDQIDFSQDTFGRETLYRRWITGGSSGAYSSSYTNASGNEAGGALPTSITDPHAVVRSYVYDDFGRLVRSSSNDFSTIRWEYANGRLVERRLGNGKRTDYSYDDLGRITNINHDAANPTLVGQDYQFVYDNGSTSCGITGRSCTYRRGRLAIAKIESSPGQFWEIEYDYGQDGQVEAEEWPSSRTTRYTYDSQGRLLRYELPMPTSDKVRYEYDSTNNDGEDQRELRRIVHELTAGTDYVVWGRTIQHDALGRQTRAHFGDRADGTNPSIELAYRTDGAVNTWRVRRRNSTSDVDMLNRTYAYAADGALGGWSSTVTADPARTFFWDGANRLTCAAAASGASSCPTGSTLLESYTYDVHENRATKVTPAGTTTYSNPNANNQLYDEYPPGHTIWYSYAAGDLGGRAWDRHQSVTDSNQRSYFYYGSGRMRSIELFVPGQTQGTYQEHTFTVLYDHRGRLIYIADLNESTNKERREQLYWDNRDRLIERVVTPDHTVSNTYDVDILVDFESAATAWMQLKYVNGSFSSESRRYIARDPNGLVAAVWSFTGQNQQTTVLYTADYQPFGEVRAESGTSDPGLGLYAQYALKGTEARIWNGSQTQTLRSRLVLAPDGVGDARVGQYVQPTAGAWAWDSRRHPYAAPPQLSGTVVSDRHGDALAFAMIGVATGDRVPLGLAYRSFISPYVGGRIHLYSYRFMLCPPENSVSGVTILSPFCDIVALFSPCDPSGPLICPKLRPRLPRPPRVTACYNRVFPAHAVECSRPCDLDHGCCSFFRAGQWHQSCETDFATCTGVIFEQCVGCAYVWDEGRDQCWTFVRDP